MYVIRFKNHPNFKGLDEYVSNEYYDGLFTGKIEKAKLVETLEDAKFFSKDIKTPRGQLDADFPQVNIEVKLKIE